MSFNIENGGTQVRFANVIEAIRKSGADVVALQEPWGNTEKIAERLSWPYINRAQHIISRFPLYETKSSHHEYTLVEVSTGQFVALANLHLLNEDYGPPLIQKGKSAHDVEVAEKKIRLASVLLIRDKLAPLVQHKIPVFLAGDFNSASHLDWTANTVGKLRNHRIVVSWPITQQLQQSGFIDSYRQTHPNPLQYPGYTWPAARPYLNQSIDGFNPTTTDSSERIDFIFSAGPAQVVDSQLIGEINNRSLDQSLDPWPSDHRALVSRFAIHAGSLNKNDLIPMADHSHAKAEIFVSKKSLRVGEEFTINWNAAPGNRYDYLQIASARQSLCLYTKAQFKGHMTYPAKRDCFDKGLPWPLEPGVYTISLMEDDSNKLLASTRIQIQGRD